MFIRCGNKSIEITDPMQAIMLEVKFNLTHNGKNWSSISDALYYFRDIEVNLSQFYFVLELAEKHLSTSSFVVIL